MAFVAVAVAVAVRVVPPRTAVVESVPANPTGAAWMALAEMTTTSPCAPRVTPRLTKFAEGFVLEVTQQDGSAVGVVERVHGFVEEWFDVRPVSGGGVHGIHLGGDLFAQLAAGLPADDIRGGAVCDLVEPGGEDGVRRKTVRIARETDEGGLSDFLSKMCRADLALCGGKDQIEMAADDFRERLLGVVPGVAREQFQIGVAHVQRNITADPRNTPKNLW
jgi:hypothetical protein